MTNKTIFLILLTSLNISRAMETKEEEIENSFTEQIGYPPDTSSPIVEIYENPSREEIKKYRNRLKEIGISNPAKRLSFLESIITGKKDIDLDEREVIFVAKEIIMASYSINKRKPHGLSNNKFGLFRLDYFRILELLNGYTQAIISSHQRNLIVNFNHEIVYAIIATMPDLQTIIDEEHSTSDLKTDSKTDIKLHDEDKCIKQFAILLLNISLIKSRDLSEETRQKILVALVKKINIKPSKRPSFQKNSNLKSSVSSHLRFAADHKVECLMADKHYSRLQIYRETGTIEKEVNEILDLIEGQSFENEIVNWVGGKRLKYSPYISMTSREGKWRI